MNLQKTIAVLSLSLSSFACMGMHPYHNVYAPNQSLQAQQYIYLIPTPQQYQYVLQTQQEKQRLMRIHFLQEQQRCQQYLIHEQGQLLAAIQKNLHKAALSLYSMQMDTLVGYGCQCPNVMPTTIKPSKVLARREQ
jgi:hypothetical protein